LVAENKSSSVMNGAAYVDVTGLFSTLNEYHVTALLTIVATVAAILVMSKYAASARSGGGAPQVRTLVMVLVGCLVADIGFKSVVGLRQLLGVTPNEPVIQLPYITRHIEATREAFNLGNVETVRLIPKDVGDPLPDVDELLQTPTMKNVTLWPGFCSYLEDLVDIQHRERVLATGGDTMVYGPLLEIMQQQQKLRAYYKFLDVDTVRYEVNGEKTILASAVREVPLLEPQPWLAWWGQQYMLFTHGYGIVTTHVAEKTESGDPIYVSKGVPVKSSVPALQAENQRAYYAEGAGSMAYSNVKNMTELDYPTDEGRETTTFAADVKAGVKIDSMLKRLVLGYKSGQFWQVMFSELIDENTRVHYFRTPLERLERVAPFLFYDSDPFAVAAQNGMYWMVNGMTYTDGYPYSAFHTLGDKSDTRSPFPFRDHKTVNYVRDSVKCTVDAYTGSLKLYKFEDEPVVNVLQNIYPDLFTDVGEMPDDVRAQLQYPVQLMHVQFDDTYILYQMDDTMTFFNMEDMWDDGDEVLGPMLDSGLAIRFSIEPFYVMVDTTDPLMPDSAEKTQFALSMAYTPQSALNLRAIPMVYNDGADYGKMICFQVPKGHYFLGPEQADALIDEEPAIAQQFSWWNRQGLEVIRGHTTALLVQGEVIYVEPVFLRSEQNRVTQLKRVCVVFRGKAAMGNDLEEALRKAVDAHKDNGTK
ncbi:MAG: UPF0182 family protein, partial [Planctomycetota bacterium]